jgi:hypothetical protein
LSALLWQQIGLVHKLSTWIEQGWQHRSRLGIPDNSPGLVLMKIDPDNMENMLYDQQQLGMSLEDTTRTNNKKE